MALCFFCKKDLELEGKVSFHALCPHCGMDAHVCCNCGFYAPGYSNNCREPAAEKVRDPEGLNHCEYFVLAGTGKIETSEADKAKAALEALFKKK